MTFSVEQNVLQFDVAVNDAILKCAKKMLWVFDKRSFYISYLVQVFQSEDNFANVDPDLVFREFFPLVQVGEQFTSINVI